MAARRNKVSRALYGRWERDDERGPHVEIGKLQVHERCLLYRRRAGSTQQTVADDLGCCRYVVNQMEHGDLSCDDLTWYWEQ